MDAFITDYFEWLAEAVGDPALSKRRTPEQNLRDLHAHHCTVFERLLKVSRGRSNFNYAEVDFTLFADQENYRWPGNFRRFQALELRQDDDPDQILDRLKPVEEWMRTRGLLIGAANTGFRITPRNTISEEQTWKLRYNTGPIMLHWGVAAGVEAGRIQLQANVPITQGQYVNWPNYYAGSEIHIFDADTGAGQSAKVTNFGPGDRWCELESDFAPTPSGTVKYEFRSFLPRGYDKLLALSVALSMTAGRQDPDRRRLLMQEWKELFAASRSFLNGTSSESYRPRRSNDGYMATVDPMAL